MGRRGPLSLPIFLLFTIGAVYPLIFTMNKIAVDAGTPPLAFTFWQTLGAAVLLLILAAWRRALPRLEARHPQGLLRARPVRHRRTCRAHDLARAEAADRHPLHGGDPVAPRSPT